MGQNGFSKGQFWYVLGSVNPKYVLSKIIGFFISNLFVKYDNKGYIWENY